MVLEQFDIYMKKKTQHEHLHTFEKNNSMLVFESCSFFNL